MNRKEKLEEAKRLYETANADQKYVLESLFPELAETEDERIRKELIEFVKSRGGFKQEYIAWLEKQGEKTKPIEDFDSEFERQISHLVASIMNKEYSYTKAFVKWTSDALLNYAKHEIEKQGEQKLTNNQFTPEQADILDKHIDKFLEQKLAWSEEDEKYTNIVLAALYNPSAEGLYSFHKVKSSDVTNWFISLKDRVRLPSQWKPTDKDIFELQCVINNDPYNGFILKALLEQLKKLKEE